MPVARIYASLVEEAEPICADLLARGYNVEIVFPDAVPTNPADLELRVERCSAEQAIARVEAGGSPSRCMFVAPAKGPRSELLLVEMTVLATGTDGRHPMAMPGIALVPGHLSAASVESSETQNAPIDLAEILPFPEAKPNVACDNVDAEKRSEPEIAAVVKTEHVPSRKHEGDQNLSKDLIAELNVFLAHAPAVERPDGLHVRIFENVRQSASIERARKNWEGLTLAGVAASVVVLVTLGWYAGPSHPRQVVAAASPVVLRTVSEPVAAFTLPKAANVRSGVLLPSTSSPPLHLASERRRIEARPRKRLLRVQDHLVAQDRVNTIGPAASQSPRKFSKAEPPTTTSELIRQSVIRTTPIKIITDLK